MLLACCLLLPGCHGCSGSADDSAEAQGAKKKKDEEDAKKKKEAEKPKPDFEATTARVEPFVVDRLSQCAKPGHWLTVQQSMKANNYDFVGELAAELSIIDDGRTIPLGLANVPFYVVDNRPAVLPKGQQKFLEIELFVPTASKRPRLTTELRQHAGSSVMSQMTILEWMPAYQYYFFVLSRESNRYKQLCDGLETWPVRQSPVNNSASIPGQSTSNDNLDQEAGEPLYRFVVPQLIKDKQVPLPTGPLSWTSIAYVLWDDVDPSKLSLDQQRAMLDWLNWGGQLILSGPETLTALRGSFLDSYLPVVSGKARELSAEVLAPLAAWSPTGTTAAAASPAPVHPWSGAELLLRPGGHFLADTGDLVAERQAGRGRVVATGFRLHLRELRNWPGFESFFNACVLRQPPRTFVNPDGFDAKRGTFHWTDSARDTSALITTGTRYLSHDIGVDGTFIESASEAISRPGRDENQAQDPFNPASASLLEKPTPGAGLGGWNDQSAISVAAREALGRAAGIDIPKSSFVAWSLAAYLLVLVPVNWGLFKLIGRVELAWAAVPLLAIGGAVFVTRAANLNIGFARSQNEIDVLELQAGYPRAHLTRYAALYTSLSTTYDVRMNDPHGGVQPFSIGQRSRGASSAATPLVVHRDSERALLSGFAVSSNSTAMLHAEQMYEAGGAIAYTLESGKPWLHNRTSHTFHDARVLRVNDDNELERATLGELSPGEAGRRLEFHRIEGPVAATSSAIDPPPQRTASEPSQTDTVTTTATTADKPQTVNPGLELSGLFSVVENHAGLKPGDVRLIATLDKPLDGMEVEPAASQSTRAAVLIVAHLAYAAPPQPKPDFNIKKLRPATQSIDSPPADEPPKDRP